LKKKKIRMSVNEIRAKGTAFRVTRDYGIEHPREIDLEAIAEDKGVTVVDAPLYGLEARLLRQRECGIIRVKAGIPEPGRRRFAIAHELGHWLLHADISQLFLCTSENIRDYKNHPVEIEANMFAAELLMPTRLFQKSIKSMEPTIENIAACAEECRTSLTSTAIRFTELSTYRTIVVLSKSGRVVWWRPKLDGSHPWIHVGVPLHSQSLAKYCTLPDRVSPIEAVPNEAWLDDNWFSRSVEVTEQSILLPGYDTVLTVLILTDKDYEPDTTSRKWSQ
jgi:Zn-dependent peptidase ImmA (M78 family)